MLIITEEVSMQARRTHSQLTVKETFVSFAIATLTAVILPVSAKAVSSGGIFFLTFYHSFSSAEVSMLIR